MTTQDLNTLLATPMFSSNAESERVLKTISDKVNEISLFADAFSGISDSLSINCFDGSAPLASNLSTAIKILSESLHQLSVSIDSGLCELQQMNVQPSAEFMAKQIRGNV